MPKIPSLLRCFCLVLSLPLSMAAAPQGKMKPECKYRISHSGFAEFVLPKEGGTHKLEIKVGPSVKWTVQNSAYIEWITILDGSSGTGPGTLTIQLEANPEGSCRVGELAIAGIVPIYGLPIRILQEGTGIFSEPKREPPPPSIIVLEPFQSDRSRTGARQYRQVIRKR